MTLAGSNLGSAPKIRFLASEGGVFTWDPLSVSANSLTVTLPSGFGDGTVQVDNGKGYGNAYYLKSIFAPSLRLQTTGAGPELPFTFILNQGAGQLALQGFRIDMFNVDRDLSGLAAGKKVGAYTITGGTGSSDVEEYDLLVKSSATGTAVLTIAPKDTTAAYGTLTIQKISGTIKGLSLTYSLAFESRTPLSYGYPVRGEMQLSGLPIKTSVVAGQSYGFSAEIQSAPAGISGTGTSLRVTIP